MAWSPRPASVLACWVTQWSVLLVQPWLAVTLPLSLDGKREGAMRR